MARWKEREEEVENQLNKGALWAITYGDIMSYLMILFLILFSFSFSRAREGRLESTIMSIQQVFGGEVSPEKMQKLDRLEKERSAIREMKEKIRDPMVQVLESERKVRMVLESPVLFETGRSELKAEALPVLHAIVESVRGLGNDIVVEGHTDNVPFTGARKDYSNWELSMARAYSVVHYLEKNGINPGRLSGLGYGEHRPLEPNATEAGRRKNRRIEINLLKSE